MTSAKIIRRLSASFLSLLLICGAVAYAQQRPDRATMRQVMGELGVGPNTMRSCFRSTGLKRGQTISEGQRAAIRTLLLTCFQESNPDLTEDQFQSAMNKMWGAN